MLNDRELAVLQAAVDRIIPADDFPSGWQAGVGDYLLRLLQREPAALTERYHTGLAALDAEANGQFAELAPADQDALLERVSRGEILARWPIDPAAFFSTLVDQCMEGFYGDPANGGNRNNVAWQMIGFEVRG